MIGGSVGLILAGCVAEQWAKNGVGAISILIKRKRPKLCRKWMCGPGSIGRNEVKYP